MIKLDVEGYCHECPEFEATTNDNVVFYADGMTRDCMKIVSCEHKERCGRIKRYLERKAKDNGEN